jgi:serine/threonine-protein kinase RsbW
MRRLLSRGLRVACLNRKQHGCRRAAVLVSSMKAGDPRHDACSGVGHERQRTTVHVNRCSMETRAGTGDGQGMIMAEPMKLRLPADVESLGLLRRFIEEVAVRGNCNPRAVADLVLAANEAATNAIVHGYRGQDGYLEAEVTCKQDALVVRLRDRAPAFDPRQVPAPDLAAPLEERTPGGLGVYLMFALSDELVYRRTPVGENEIVLIRRGARETATTS